MRFSQVVPYGLVLSGHQLGKPSDVRRNMSTHEGSVCIYYTPKVKDPLINV